jgi:hypothetical protein
VSSYAPIPADVPDGMTHVGWRCTNPDHTCLMEISRADTAPVDGQVHLYQADHNARWVPVFARTADLPEGE